MQPTFDPRATAQLVRDALNVLYEQQGGQGDTTLIGELEREAAGSLRTIQSVVDDMARQRRIWLANDMSTLLADAKSDIGGTFNRARWMEIQAVFDTFQKWLETPIALPGGVEVTPLVVISRRSNPTWADIAMPVIEEPIKDTTP